MTGTWPRGHVIAVTVESGLAETQPLPVVAMTPKPFARLSWGECEQLGRLLLDAKHRYA